MSRETKTLQFKIKATGETTVDGQQFGQIEAYGAAFNNVDEGNDRILPGAFTRTIQNSKARAKARDKKYMLKMLWQHDANEIIGGWYDLSEDGTGLRAKGDIALATQRGREFYELAKAEMIDEFSIIYDIPQGGAKYDKSGVRDLSELRLFSIDPVTFPMNDDPHTIKVKSLEYKSVCGDTSLPIGPRNESWDGSKAEKQIFAYAEKADGSLDASKAKKCFLQIDGDSSLKGSYHYPFCYVENESPRISVGGVKACAGAISGGRGASTSGGDVDGMRKKVATMYSRINKKYPDDPELTPPWEDDGKSMNRRQFKTLMEHYNEEMAEDLLEDWQEVYVCSLTCAIIDAFTIGDQPASDISDALDTFKELVLSKFVAQAQEVNLSQYLSDNTYSYSSATDAMYGSDGYGSLGYMSRSTRLFRKAERALSAANQAVIDDHVKAMKSMARKAKADMKAHVSDMHDAIDNMAGNNQDEDEDQSGKSRGTFATKAGRAVSAANASAMHDMADKAMDIMQEHTKALSKAANDLADGVKPGADPDYDEDEDVEDTKSARSYRNGATPRTQPRSLKRSTANEEEVPAAFLQELRLLRTK